MREVTPSLAVFGVDLATCAFLLLSSSCAVDDVTPPAAQSGTGGASGAAADGGAGVATGGTGAAGTGGSLAGNSGAGGSTGGSSTGGSAGASVGGSSGAGGSANGGTSSGSGGAGIGGAGTGSGGMTAGSGGNSGSSGASGSGGVAGSGGGSPCPSTAKLCDGFEGPAPGQTGSAWTVEGKGTTTVAADTTKPHSGAKSVHIAYKGMQGFITETQTFMPGGTKAQNDEMWGRAWVWFQVSSGSTQGHFVFIRAEGMAVAPNEDGQLHIAGGYQQKFAAEIRTPSAGGDRYKYATPNIAVPLATPKWECWEWHTTGTNTLDFYIDNTKVPGMVVAASDNWPFPNFNKFYLGFLQFSAMPTGEMWIDDVVLGTAQVGCGN